MPFQQTNPTPHLETKVCVSISQIVSPTNKKIHLKIVINSNKVMTISRPKVSEVKNVSRNYRAYYFWELFKIIIEYP